MIRTVWAKLVLWWENYCFKHKTNKKRDECRFIFGRWYCTFCYIEKSEKKSARRQARLKRAENRIDKSVEVLKPKEEQWQTIQNKK